jgi:hypothetical protein
MVGWKAHEMGYKGCLLFAKGDAAALLQRPLLLCGSRPVYLPISNLHMNF